jgi:hypothetical protein
VLPGTDGLRRFIIPEVLLHQRPGQTPGMRPSELRDRAQQEAAELGPEPLDPRDRAVWSEERRGCLVLLDALAEHDATLLRRAALAVAEDLSDPLARALLLEAADAEQMTAWHISSPEGHED